MGEDGHTIHKTRFLYVWIIMETIMGTGMFMLCICVCFKKSIIKYNKYKNIIRHKKK